jgi:hypothetical protein
MQFEYSCVFVSAFTIRDTTNLYFDSELIMNSSVWGWEFSHFAFNDSKTCDGNVGDVREWQRGNIL